MEESTDYFLQCILALSDDTHKDSLLHLGVKISDLPDLNKRTFAVEIS